MTRKLLAPAETAYPVVQKNAVHKEEALSMSGSGLLSTPQKKQNILGWDCVIA